MNNQIKKRKLNTNLIIFVSAFVFLFFLCYLFPYTGDDWAWGGSLGIDRLNNFFKNYNGRYLGNLAVIALTRSNLLKTSVMSITLFIISLISYRIAGENRREAFTIFFFALLATPRLVFRQAIVWTSGFANYVLPIPFLLAYLYLIKNVAQDRDISCKKYHIPYVAFLGFAGALFMEHVTLYQIGFSALLIAYVLFTRRKVYPVHISYFLCSILGAILMFSNGAYRNIVDDADGYREIPKTLSGLIQHAVFAFKETIYQESMFNNIVLNTVLAIFIIFLVIEFTNKKNNRNKVKNFLAWLCAGCCIAYPIYAILTVVYVEWPIPSDARTIFEAIFTLLTMAAFIIITALCITNKPKRRRMLFELLSILILTVPLFVVQPIGGRCFFITYVFFAIYLTELVSYLLGGKERLSIYRSVSSVFLLLCVCFCGYYISIFVPIAKDDRMRTNYIFEQIEQGNETVLVPNLVYDSYLWTSLPKKGTGWEWRYKNFHGIDQKIIFENITNAEWEKTKNN